MATTESQPQAVRQVHPHAIRWDVEQQLWVCSVGCGFTRPKRDGEVVPSREEAREEARIAGTGADFADLRPRSAVATGAGPETPAGGAPSVATGA